MAALGTGERECEVAQSCLFATPWTVAHQALLSVGIFQARILEWVAMPFSRNPTQVSHIAGEFFTILATREAHEYWSGQPIPSPGDHPDSGIKPRSPALHADSLPAELPGKSTICRSLLTFISIGSVMLSNPLILCCPYLLLSSIFPIIRVFSNDLTLHQVAKILELQL